MRTPISQRVSTIPAGTEWIPVAASQSATALSATGAAGDILLRVVCVVATAATAQVQIQDGASGTPRTILPNSPGGGIGTYSVELGVQSSAGGWYVITAAGVSIIAIGQFS